MYGNFLFFSRISVFFPGEKCSVVYTMGYRYQNWYNLTDNISTMNTQQSTADDKSAVSLKFYVQGSSDAHVVLAAEPPSPGYEIVLGGGANSFCDIRKSRRYHILIYVRLEHENVESDFYTTFRTFESLFL